MNKEVSFPVAKLLKEKEFNEPCQFLRVAGKYRINYEKEGDLFDNGMPSTQKPIDWYLAPTIAEVVMWLYEKHGIWISVYSDKSLNWESLFSIKIDWIYPKDSPDAEDNNPKYFEYKGENEFISPTEAYEAAIKYCLKEII